MSKIRVWTKADKVTPSMFSVPGYRMMRPAVPTGKKPISSKYMRYAQLCEEHNELTPSVVLDTYYHNPETDSEEKLGPRKYCFFCWMPVEKAP